MIFNKKTIGIISLLLAMLAMLAVMAFSLGDGNSLGKSWKTAPKIEVDSGKTLADSVILEITDERIADKIYIKIGNVYDTDDDGRLAFAMDSSAWSTELEKNVISFGRESYFVTVKNSDNYRPGWYLLADKLDLSAKFLKISTFNSFQLDEVVLLDKDNNIIELSAYGGFDDNRRFVRGYATSSAVVDGQASFGLDSMHILSEKEESMLIGSQNLFAFQGYYVSDFFTPLGVALNGIGVLIFGANPFGIRIVSFLFSFATLILIYFFAKRVFGNELYGISAMVIWLLAGIGLSVGGVASSVSPALFFLLLGYFYLYGFYTGKIEGSEFSAYRNLIASGAFVAVAGAIDPFAYAGLAGVAFFGILSCVRTIKPLRNEYLKSTGLAKEFSRERLVKGVFYTVLSLVLVIIVLPLIATITFFGIFSAIYADHYSVNGIFAITFANIGAVARSRGGSNVFGWLIGLGSEKTSGIVSVTIFANKALVALSVLLTVSYAILFFLGKTKVLKNEKLGGVITSDKSAAFIAVSAVLIYLFGLLGGINADYSCFAYSLLFLTLALPSAYRLYNGNVNKTFFGVSLTVVSVVIAVFFLLSVVCFLGISVPQSASKYLYDWMT